MTEGSDHPQYDKHLRNMAELEAYKAIGTTEAVKELREAAKFSVQYIGKLAADNPDNFIGLGAQRTLDRVIHALDALKKG